MHSVVRDFGYSESPLRLDDALFDLLPGAVYICDLEGRILRYNRYAVELWGRAPHVNADRYCGSHRLLRLDGSSIPINETPMAETLQTGIPVRNREVVMERPDGSRIVALLNIDPLRDSAGKVSGGVNCFRDITEHKRAEEERHRAEQRSHELLAALPTAIYTTDASGRITFFNEAAAELWGCRPEIGKSEFCGSWKLYLPDGTPLPHDECPMAQALRGGRPIRGAEAVAERPDGSRVPFIPYPTPLFDSSGTLVGGVNMLVDISDRKASEQALLAQTHRLETLNHAAKSISSDLNLESIVQTATEAATEVTGARFGAFFYNVVDEAGERYTLYTLSGAPREAFDGFGLPRNTAVFEPTFRGVATVRSDDIRKDPRYGKAGPHYGMPSGHLPVVSYLAVPVVSRSGEVHGGLFFGHEKPGMFAADSEELATGIAAHAAVAIDNARLYQAAQTEILDRRKAQFIAQRLASIVESSDDAIISKDLNGYISTWNRGAERLFGYTAEEAIGKPVAILIPPERHDEEPFILDRLRRGEHIDHYETVRVRKDGSHVHISLTVSPIRDADGRIIGASKIARDISDRKKAEERQQLLLNELNHRVKNTLATVQSIATHSFRAEGGGYAYEQFEARLLALARAHNILTQEHWKSAELHDLVADAIAPHGTDAERITIRGPHLHVTSTMALSIAMALHELCTNAAKYGALSTTAGQVKISWDVVQSGGGPELHLRWEESGGPLVQPPTRTGFGSRLIRSGLARELNAAVRLDFSPPGVVCEIAAPLEME